MPRDEVMRTVGGQQIWSEWELSGGRYLRPGVEYSTHSGTRARFLYAQAELIYGRMVADPWDTVTCTPEQVKTVHRKRPR